MNMFKRMEREKTGEHNKVVVIYKAQDVHFVMKSSRCRYVVSCRWEAEIARILEGSICCCVLICCHNAHVVGILRSDLLSGGHDFI